MRQEDEHLQCKYMNEMANKEKVRMEEEEFEQKEREIAQEWRKKKLDYGIERNNLIAQ